MLSHREFLRIAGLLLFFGVAICSLSGQSKWTIQRYGLADGLPDRSVIRSVQDSLGYRWLATETGMYRFDGHRFDRPPFLENLGLDGEKVIRDMTIDHLGRVVSWIGGSDYLQVIDSWTNEVARIPTPATAQTSETFSQFLMQYPLPVSLVQLHGPETRIYQMNKSGQWQLELTSEALDRAQESYRYLGNSPDQGHYFLANKAGLVTVLKSGQPTQKIQLPDYHINPALIQLDSRGRLWWQPNDERPLQLLRPNQKQFEPFVPLQRTDGIRYTKFYEDQHGNLIFGAVGPTSTTALTLLYAEGTVEDLGRILRQEQKIVSISGSNFKQSFDLASYGGYYRVSKPLDRLGVTNYLFDPAEVDRSSYKGRIMRGFTEGPDGELYGITEGGMWLRMRPPEYALDTFYPQIDGKTFLPKNYGSGHNLVSSGAYVYGLYSSRISGNYQGWLGRYEPATDQWKAYPLPLEGGFGRYVLLLPDGDLIVFAFRWADRLSQIYRFNPREEKFWFFGDFNVDLPVRSRASAQNAIYDPGRKMIWLAAGNGLFGYPVCLGEAGLPSSRQNPCYFASQKPIEQPAVNFHVQSLLLREDGKLILGSLGEGVQIFDPESGQLQLLAYDPNQLTSRNGSVDLPSNQVAELVRLDSQHLVITTFNGMVVADLNSRRSIAYNTTDGLPNNEFNRLSAFQSSQGELLLGGINGFSRISRNKLLPKATGPTPALSRYYRFDEDERRQLVSFPRPEDLQEIIIPPDQAYLGFNFTTPGTDGATYRSWLEGYEIDYGLANSSGEVEYLRVPAGSYTLHVEATNQLGESSTEPLQIPLRVRRPWYFRPWFLILCQLLLIGAGVLIYRNRIQRIRAQEAEKSRVSRQLAELEMKILRQQLNPHFIFNALGAIQHFIQGMRGPDAMEYLADFAKLMRMFLESSKQSYIFLNDELKLIKLYVRLEQLRFNNSFDVEYEIDPDLEMEMEDIPSLLLQPFVENAINHGLFHLKRRGKLIIGMRMDEEERIIITIADDGIGRKAAADLRAKTYKKHKSRATQIVEERLEIFQRSADTDVQITTEDLYPDRAETGTRVTIIVEGS